MNPQKLEKELQHSLLKLSVNSPLYKYLLTVEHNLYDDNIHSYKRSELVALFRSLAIVRLSTENPTLATTYYANAAGNTHFTTYHALKNELHNEVVFSYRMKRIVEYVFRISIGMKPSVLHTARRKTFVKRFGKYLSCIKLYNNSFPSLSFNESQKYLGNYTRFSAKSMRDYVAGLGHIVYLSDVTQAFCWYSENQNSQKYKQFTYLDDGLLMLQFFADGDPIQTFIMNCQALPEDINKYGHEDSQLLWQLKPYYRKERIHGILKAL